MTLCNWISFRDALSAAEGITGVRTTATQKRPTLEALLWHAAQGEIATTGRRWERPDKYGSMIAVEEDECEDEVSAWKSIMLTMIYKKEAGKDLDNVQFDHFDTLTGSFEFHTESDDTRPHIRPMVHLVVGLQFDAVDLHRVFGHKNELSPADQGKSAQTFENGNTPRSGERSPRRLADPWPAWVAELALHIHTKGYPDGTGSQGQGDLIKAVADALAERGIETLSRTTVQPVIQAVLDRYRAADD